MIQEQHNPDLFIDLPFSLPPNDQASAWLAELDFVDPYTASLAEVWALARTAPSLSAGYWQAGLANLRQADAAALAELRIGRRQPPGEEEVAAFLRHLDAAAPIADLEPGQLDALAAACPASLKYVIVMLMGLAALKIECEMAAKVASKVEAAALDEWRRDAEEAFVQYLWSLTLAAPWSQQARQSLKMYVYQAPLQAVGMSIQEVLDSTSGAPKPSATGRGMSM